MTTARSRYMRHEEVAEELGYKSRGSIYRLADAGELVEVPIGGTRRITRESFDAYCARQEAKAAKPLGKSA